MSSNEQAFQRMIVRSHLGIWRHALGLSRERALATEDIADQEVDVLHFAIALDQFVRAAKLAQRFHGGIQASVTRFERLLPTASHIRDVVIHFDAYELGKGTNQAALGPKDFAPWYDPQTIQGTVVFNLGDDLKLDITEAWNAADQLYNEVMDLLR